MLALTVKGASLIVGLFNIFICFLRPADAVVSMGMVQQLVSVLRSPHLPFHEHVLGALCW